MKHWEDLQSYPACCFVFKWSGLLAQASYMWSVLIHNQLWPLVVLASYMWSVLIHNHLWLNCELATWLVLSWEVAPEPINPDNWEKFLKRPCHNNIWNWQMFNKIGVWVSPCMPTFLKVNCLVEIPYQASFLLEPYQASFLLEPYQAKPTCWSLTLESLLVGALPWKAYLLEPYLGKPTCWSLTKPTCWSLTKLCCWSLTKPTCWSLTKLTCWSLTKPTCWSLTKLTC